MDKWENNEDRERRKAILRKAEFEVNLAERELKEWKMQKKVSPSITEITNRTYITDETSKTPTGINSSDELNASPSKMREIEKRLKDLEEVRQTENEKHRKEIERLENMIDKLRDSRKIEPKFEILQKAYQEKTNELERKNREIQELKKQLKTGEIRNRSSKALKRENSYCGRKERGETENWKEKAYELTTKYFRAIKGMREDIEKLKKSCLDEMREFKVSYVSALKQLRK